MAALRRCWRGPGRRGETRLIGQVSPPPITSRRAGLGSMGCPYRPSPRSQDPSSTVVLLDPITQGVVNPCLPAAPSSAKMVDDPLGQPDGGRYLRSRLRGTAPAYRSLGELLRPAVLREVGSGVGVKTGTSMPSGPRLKSSAPRMSLSFATCSGATRRAVRPS